MSSGDGYAAQRQAAAGAGGQGIDAHLLQGIAAVGIVKIKLGGRKSVAVILVQRDRQSAGGGRGIGGACRRHRRCGRAGQALRVVLIIRKADRHGDHLAHIAPGQEVGCRGRAADGRVRAGSVPVPLITENHIVETIGIADARGIHRQGLALGGCTANDRRSGGRGIGGVCRHHRRRGRAGDGLGRVKIIGVADLHPDHLAYFGIGQGVGAQGRVADRIATRKPSIGEHGRVGQTIDIHQRGGIRAEGLAGHRRAADGYTAAGRVIDIRYRPPGLRAPVLIIAIIIPVADLRDDRFADLGLGQGVGCGVRAADDRESARVGVSRCPFVGEGGRVGQPIRVAKVGGIYRQGLALDQVTVDGQYASGWRIAPYHWLRGQAGHALSIAVVIREADRHGDPLADIVQGRKVERGGLADDRRVRAGLVPVPLVVETEGHTIHIPNCPGNRD